MCSSRSAKHIGSGDAFTDDKQYSVAQLFRGVSTRDSLEQPASEAAQRVSFVTPSLPASIDVSLDGIIIDPYDAPP